MAHSHELYKFIWLPEKVKKITWFGEKSVMEMREENGFFRKMYTKHKATPLWTIYSERLLMMALNVNGHNLVKLIPLDIDVTYLRYS